MDNITPELLQAVSAFQSEMTPVVFDAVNPYFKSRYATLSALVSASSKLLGKHGLSVIQTIEDDGSVRTILGHKGGGFIQGKVSLKPVKDDPQGRGSAITYARRYAYASILGLVSDSDDDGNTASAPGGEVISSKDVSVLRDELIALEKSESKFCSFLGVATLEELPKKDLIKAKEALATARKKTV
jgi:hypothetical protein